MAAWCCMPCEVNQEWPEHETVVFFTWKVAASPAMQATLRLWKTHGCVLGSFGSHNVFCHAMLVPVCVVLNAFLASHPVVPETHRNYAHRNKHCMQNTCWRDQATPARNRVFFRVKWLQPAMKATSSVRRLRLGSFGSFYVFCNNACSCVRSSMRFLTLWCQIALEWLHDVTCRVLWGGSRSTKPCRFSAVQTR